MKRFQKVVEYDVSSNDIKVLQIFWAFSIGFSIGYLLQDKFLLIMCFVLPLMITVLVYSLNRKVYFEEIK